MKQGGSGAGHSHKHSGAHKAKHTPHKAHKKHAPGHHPKPQQGGAPSPIHVVGKPITVTSTSKRRGWSPGSDVACCSAQALGTLLGWPDDEVVNLYWRTARDPDSGVSILGTLQASRLPFGEPFGACGFIGADQPDLAAREVIGRAAKEAHGLILGASLPEPHAIAVTPDGTWWSWGEPFDPAGWPELVVEEAWAVAL